jgi:hypothetical protein
MASAAPPFLGRRDWNVPSFKHNHETKPCCTYRFRMDQEDELEWLKRKIERYRALARQITDDETARLIQELVSELEQRLRAKLH